MEAFLHRIERTFSSRVQCCTTLSLFGSCYTMADQAIVFGVREKWEYWPLKAEKQATDFAAVW